MKGLRGPARDKAARRCGCVWIADYRRDGERVYESAGTDMREAARLLARREKEVAGIEHVPDGASFEDVGQRWLATKEATRRPGTVHGYRCSLRHATRYFGKMNVSRVSGGLVAEMEAALITAGLSPLYARNARSVAIMVLGHAEDAGLISAAPHMRRKRGETAEREEQRHFSPAELQAVWEASTSRLTPMFQFAAMTGLRAGELLALEPQDIDADKLVCRVRRAVDSRSKTIGPPKSKAARRDVDIPQQAIDLLPRQDIGRYWPVHYSTAIDHWHKALTAAGLEPCGLHSLRHSNAAVRITVLRQDLVYVAKQLGHSDPSITLREYGHLIVQPQTDASGLALMLHAGTASA